jgi:protein phosphatase
MAARDCHPFFLINHFSFFHWPFAIVATDLGSRYHCARKQRSLPMPDSSETGEWEPIPAGGKAAPSPLVRADLAGMSHMGKVRTNNEDHFLITEFGRHITTLQTNLPAEEAPGGAEKIGYGLLVADGVGGHAGGEVASRMAITTVVRLVCDTPDWILRVDQEDLSDEVMRRARDRYDQVDALLTEYVKTDAGLVGFGTTLTMAWSVGTDLFIANLGDTRAYLHRKSELRRLTLDHTVAQGLVDLGVIPQHAAASHRLRHVLTRSLGPASLEGSPDVQQLSLEDGDCLLLCTDGLTDMVNDAQIQAILAGNEPAAQTCQRLIDAALQAGGADNVTVVVGRYCVG